MVKPRLDDMQKIVVLNPKGGSGKSTIATNLASHFAVEGLQPALMDYDSQGSSTRWIKKRDENQPHIHSIAAYERDAKVTRSFQLRVPSDTKRLIVDTAASMDPQRLAELTFDADVIVVPVLPCDIDFHAAALCISDLLLIAKVDRARNGLAVIANRVRQNTIGYRTLMQFLRTLGIPIVGVLRDTQNYVHAAERGVSIFEMPPHRVRKDLQQWGLLLRWLDARREAKALSRTTTPVDNVHWLATPYRA